MKLLRFILIFTLLNQLEVIHAQGIAENSGNEFKVKIGNIGFAIDSIDFHLGTVLTGKLFEKEIEITNQGNKTISFLNNKQQPWLDVMVNPSSLGPGSSGTIIMKFNPDLTYQQGKFDAEMSIQTDDAINPYKYLYFTAFITEDTNSRFGVGIIDSVPRLIFDQLNYSFGDLTRSKVFDQTFTFANLGAEELVIDSLAFSKGCKILSYPKKSYLPGETGVIQVRINTMYSYGIQHRWVKIHSNDPRNPIIILGTHGSVYLKSEKNRDPDFCYE